MQLEDPAEVIDVVLHGRGSMPSFAESLTAPEAAAVITYIRTAWGNNASPVTAAQAR